MPELTKPEIRYGDAGLSDYLKGFELMSAVASRRRQQELQIQEMHQQAYLAQQKHDLDMLKLAQDKPLVDAEVENYKETTDLHKTQQRLLNEGVGTAAQRKSEILKKVGEASKESAKIDAPPGTEKWQNEFILWDNDPRWADIKGTPEFQRLRNGKLAEHKFSTIQNRISQNAIDTKVNKLLNDTGLGLGAFNNEKDWGTNKDGSRFINQDLKSRAVVPTTADVVGSKDSTGQPLYRSITLKPNDYDFYKKAADNIKNRIRNSLHAPDPLLEPEKNPAEITDDESVVIEPAPADPSQRIPNKTYKLPKGNFKWTGNGWIQP